MSSEEAPESKGTESAEPESVSVEEADPELSNAPPDPFSPISDGTGGPDEAFTDCENCATPLQGRYCHSCGQEARSLDVSFRSFVGEWLAAALGFDGRIWRTLRCLLFKPGGLSIDFLEGRRARYVSPLRLYFFVSVAVFLAITVSDSSVVNFSERDASSGSNLSYSWQTGDRSGHGSLLPTEEQTPAQDPSIDDEAKPDSSDEVHPDETPEDEEDSEGEVEQKVGEWVSDAAQSFKSNPDAINKAFLDRMPHAFFLLVPIYALFLKLLFRRRYKSYVQHLVVSLHLHTLGFVLVTLGSVTDYLLGFRGDEDGPVSALALIVLLVHNFIGFRKIYGDRRRTLLWKFALLSFAHLVSLLLLLGITLVATFALL